jgi:hypothetical protein
MDLAKGLKELVSSIERDCGECLLPPEGGLDAIGQPVIGFALVRGTRGYLEKIVHQINGSYSNGWYDACAVMVRRLVETLIIEVFEAHNLSAKITNASGDFFYLSDLINIMLAETSWNLSRNAKKSLPKLKDIGDKSAHSRRFNAIRNDIDKIQSDLRVIVQEFVYLAQLK